MKRSTWLRSPAMGWPGCQAFLRCGETVWNHGGREGDINLSEECDMSLDCKVALDLAKHESEQGDYHRVCPECSSTDIDFQEKVWVRREVLGTKGGVLQVSGAYEELRRQLRAGERVFLLHNLRPRMAVTRGD